MLDQLSKGPEAEQTQKGWFASSMSGLFLNNTASWKRSLMMMMANTVMVMTTVVCIRLLFYMFTIDEEVGEGQEPD